MCTHASKALDHCNIHTSILQERATAASGGAAAESTQGSCVANSTLWYYEVAGGWWHAQHSPSRFSGAGALVQEEAWPLSFDGAREAACSVDMESEQPLFGRVRRGEELVLAGRGYAILQRYARKLEP
jgi:hypothetical protein